MADVLRAQADAYAKGEFIKEHLEEEKAMVKAMHKRNQKRNQEARLAGSADEEGAAISSDQAKGYFQELARQSELEHAQHVPALALQSPIPLQHTLTSGPVPLPSALAPAPSSQTPVRSMPVLPTPLPETPVAQTPLQRLRDVRG